jgi:serine protease Do
MNTKQVLSIVALSALTSVGSMWAYNKFSNSGVYYYQGTTTDSGKIPSNYAHFDNASGIANAPTDFTAASNAAIPATVHITTKTTRSATNNLPRQNPFGDLFGFDMDDFFGDRMRAQPQQASGSGAIISEDGFIVTNNHVVDGADDITVTLNNRRSFKAKVVGADASSDLAVIKVEAKSLPFLLYGNSDEVKVGQWVLAVGYPLTLQTTVTAGIVSAKGRTLDINRRQSNAPVESFIQTDAAVNPGNSGGPLISTDGKLIGINSAIASPTGSYAGYSFTIPVNIVKKTVSDLMKFGTAQRAYLGVEYAPDNVSEEVKKQNGILDGEGVYVSGVPATGAAKAAGIQKGDFITKINGVPVYSGADMVGQIATYRPGDKIKLSYRRDNKDYETNVVLRNSSGNTDVVKKTVMDNIGATLATLDKKTAAELGVKGGVIVKDLDENGLMQRSKVQEGFVILKVNGADVKTVEEFRKALDDAGGTAKLEGIFPGYEGVYQFPLKLNSGN